MKWSTSVANQYVEADLGASREADTLIIPQGHGMLSTSIEVLADDTSPPTTVRHSFTTESSDKTVKENFGSETWRYWRLKIVTAGAHKITQFILTIKDVISVGHVMGGAVDAFKYNFTRFEQQSGISPTLENAPRQRIMTLDFEHSLNNVSSNDLLTMEAWIKESRMNHPFWIDPPSFSATPDTSDRVTAFKFASPPEVRMATSSPINEVERKTFKLELIESLD